MSRSDYFGLIGYYYADSEGNIIAQMSENYDDIEHPKHYSANNFSNIECIDAIKAQLNYEEYTGFLKGNIAKYLWRESRKGCGTEDIEKLIWYAQKLLEEKK